MGNLGHWGTLEGHQNAYQISVEAIITFFENALNIIYRNCTFSRLQFTFLRFKENGKSVDPFIDFETLSYGIDI